MDLLPCIKHDIAAETKFTRNKQTHLIWNCNGRESKILSLERIKKKLLYNELPQGNTDVFVTSHKMASKALSDPPFVYVYLNSILMV